VGDQAAWVPAVQYFGTKGFFARYDAHPNELLEESVRVFWQDAVARLQQGTLAPAKLAVAVRAAEDAGSPTTRQTRAAFLAQLWAQLS